MQPEAHTQTRFHELTIGLVARGCLFNVLCRPSTTALVLLLVLAAAAAAGAFAQQAIADVPAAASGSTADNEILRKGLKRSRDMPQGLAARSASRRASAIPPITCPTDEEILYNGAELALSDMKSRKTYLLKEGAYNISATIVANTAGTTCFLGQGDSRDKVEIILRTGTNRALSGSNGAKLRFQNLVVDGRGVSPGIVLDGTEGGVTPVVLELNNVIMQRFLNDEEGAKALIRKKEQTVQAHIENGGALTPTAR